MSMVLNHISSCQRGNFTDLFARIVQSRRRELDLSVDQAAELTGITATEWHAIEAGWLPDEIEIVPVMAQILQLPLAELRTASFFSLLGREDEAIAQ